MTEDKLNLLRCISICIHFEDNQFKTVEDKTIREKSIYVNCLIKEMNKKLILHINNKKEIYDLYDIVGLDFNHHKHISSKFVYFNNKFIFSAKDQ